MLTSEVLADISGISLSPQMSKSIFNFNQANFRYCFPLRAADGCGRSDLFVTLLLLLVLDVVGAQVPGATALLTEERVDVRRELRTPWVKCCKGVLCA